MDKIQKTITMLANDEELPARCRDHELIGNYKGFRDCHIQPNWLLIYQKGENEEGESILWLEATGSHADLLS